MAAAVILKKAKLKRKKTVTAFQEIKSRLRKQSLD